MTKLDKWKTKQRRRLGGDGDGGLSIEAFTKAKSKPRLNPAEIRKQREYYENAKKVKKYKTLTKHLPADDHPVLAEDFQQDTLTHKARGTDSELPNSSKHSAKKVFSKRRNKPEGRNHLESLREEYLNRQQEKERMRLEKEAARKAMEEAREKALENRKVLKVKMFKRTKTGQPVMKHRLKHILDTLQQSKE